MFKNTLTGLSKREKVVFDRVCTHLNGCLQRMGIHSLDGEEDQLLIDLWMDMYPYKKGADEQPVYKTVTRKVVDVEPIYKKEMKNVKDKETGEYVMKEVDVVVGGRYVEKVVEKKVREIDFSHSLVDETTDGIYLWRAEQLLINKCKYLFGDSRVPKLGADGKRMTKIVKDAWGIDRKKVVFEDGVDPTKFGKRDLRLKVNESDLTRDGEETVTIADVAGEVDGGFEDSLLKISLERVCNETEMLAVRKFIEGDTTNRIFKDFDDEGIKFTARQMEKLKDKIRRVLQPVGAN